MAPFFTGLGIGLLLWAWTVRMWSISEQEYRRHYLQLCDDYARLDRICDKLRQKINAREYVRESVN